MLTQLRPELAVEAGLIGGFTVKGWMRAAGVVEGQISADPGPGLGHAGTGLQVDLFVFGGPPQTLDEDIRPATRPCRHVPAPPAQLLCRNQPPA